MPEKKTHAAEKTHSLELMQGKLGPAISLNDVRIAGPKSGEYRVISKYVVEDNVLRAAMVREDFDLYQNILVHGHHPERDLLMQCREMLTRKSSAQERRQLASVIAKLLDHE